GRRIRAAATFSLAAFAVVGAAAIAALASGVMPDLIQATVILPIRALDYGSYQNRPALWPLFGQDATIRGQPIAYLPTILFDVFVFALFGSPLYQRTAIIDVLLRLAYHLPWIV